MFELKPVGVREFRDHATTSLSGPDPVAVSKHGPSHRLFHSLARDETEVARAITRLGETVEQVLADSGLTEDDLTAKLDVRGTRA